MTRKPVLPAHDAPLNATEPVEVLAGVLMMAGVLLRPLALGLLGAFLFLSAVLGENPLGHILFYGALFTLVTGGAGRWARPVAGGESARLGSPMRAQPAAAAS